MRLHKEKTPRDLTYADNVRIIRTQNNYQYDTAKAHRLNLLLTKHAGAFLAQEAQGKLLSLAPPLPSELEASIGKDIEKVLGITSGEDK